MVDVARRLCEDNQIHVNEIWSYHTVGDEVRFTLVHRSREASAAAARARVAGRGAGQAGAGRPSAAAAAQRSPRRAAHESRRRSRPARARSESSAVPFVRFSRDKRGYEHIYLVHASDRRGKPAGRASSTGFARRPASRSVVSRSTRSVRRALEAQNPDVAFDWKAHRRDARSRRPTPSAGASAAASSARSKRARRRTPTSEGGGPTEPGRANARRPRLRRSSPRPRTAVAVELADGPTRLSTPGRRCSRCRHARASASMHARTPRRRRSGGAGGRGGRRRRFRRRRRRAGRRLGAPAGEADAGSGGAAAPETDRGACH